ncbi:hypothetical protein ABDK75_16095 [Gluconobacter sp. OJA]|uniref:hypothetical protein n=1 Tax=Gluconobacter sp. OJA TaxID=3145197 RepID=UPI0031F754CC
MSSSTFSPSDNFSPPRENRLYPELFALHKEIHDFSKNLNDFLRLLEIQKRIITSISEAEKEIQSSKKARRDPKDWQYIRYNFLCLGDCLAFLYMDRFALKQTYFNVETYEPKPSGGFISGKSGYEYEMKCLETVISLNVPAVLCDITNVLRYGDICLLGGNDPSFIEVKSSNTKDRRGRRQQKKLQTLCDFLISDRAENFRGHHGVTIRSEISNTPILYADEMQAAVEEAIKVGSTSFEIDECLKVVVIADGNVNSDYGNLFEKRDLSRSLFVFVNEIKTNMSWGSYYPYPLTFSEPTHFEAFIRGEVHIITSLNIDAFEKKLAPEHVSLTFEENGCEIQCHIHFSDFLVDGEKAHFVISEHMLCRIWTDFIRPRWVIENAICLIRNIPDVMLAHPNSDDQRK